MSRLLLIFSLSLIFIVSYSQANRKRFFTIEGDETDSLHSYYFERSIEMDNGHYKTASYYLSGKVRHQEDETTEEGIFIRTYFFSDGTVKGKGNFYYTTPTGEFTSFYANGNRRAELLFENEKESALESTMTVGIINYWDSLGNKIIDEGVGFCNCWLESYRDVVILESGKVEKGVKVGNWKGVDKNNDIYFEELYDNGKLIKGKQVRRDIAYSYNKVVLSAMPNGGLTGFYGYIGNTIKYPKMARRNGIQGRVFIQFVIDESGNLTECKVVKGISPDCDQEALRVIQSSPKWANATFRGRPIKQRMVLPLTFKLK